MKVYRAKLKALLDEWPDDDGEVKDETTAGENGDEAPPAQDSGKRDETAADKAPAATTGEKKIDVNTEEKTEVEAPKSPNETIITADEMEKENLEKQIAAFSLVVDEQKTAINLLIERVVKLEALFGTFEKAVDVAAKTDIRAVDLNQAVNLL